MRSRIGMTILIWGTIVLVISGTVAGVSPATEPDTAGPTAAASTTGSSTAGSGTTGDGNTTGDVHRFRVTESDGPGLAFVINGTKRKQLTLVRGETYVFNVSTPGHPFHITRDSVGGDYSGIYNKGVNVTEPVDGRNATETGTLTFTVPEDAPATLYYQCGVHQDMGAQITIVGTAEIVGGAVAPDRVNESTTVTHDVGVTINNISKDGNTDVFHVTFPDAVRGANLSANAANVTNRTDGSDVSISSSVTQIDGPDNDSIQDTLRFAVSPDGGGTVDVLVNVSVDITWPGVETNTAFPIQAAVSDSSTGTVPLTTVATVTTVNSSTTTTIDSDTLHIEAMTDNIDGDGRVGANETTDGDDVYGSIQAGVNASTQGMTIVVAPGIYNETVWINTSDIVLRGDPGSTAPGPGENASILDGEKEVGNAITLAPNASNVIIEGFEIRNYSFNSSADGLTGVGITTADEGLAKIVIRDTHFHDLGFAGIATFAADGRFQGIHESWMVTDNRISNTFLALRFENIRNLTVARNRITGNRDVLGTGMNSTFGLAVIADGDSDSASIRIKNNTFTGWFDHGFGVINLWTLADRGNSTLRSVVVMGNSIDRIRLSNGFTRGINIFARGNGSLGTIGRITDLMIATNTITGTNSATIGLAGPNSDRAEIRNITVAANELQNSSVGVSIFAGDKYMVGDIEIKDNAVNGMRTNGIRIVSHERSTITGLTVTRNRIASTGHDGIIVSSYDKSSISTVTLSMNHLTDTKASIAVAANQNASTRSITIDRNTGNQSQFGVFIHSRDNATLAEATLSQNTLTNNTEAGLTIGPEDNGSVYNISVIQNHIRNNTNGIEILNGTAVATVAIHYNSITSNTQFGILNKDNDPVNATHNWWGAKDGPGSGGANQSLDEDAPFADPITGQLANGTGDTVSESPTPGVTNIHFDPYLPTAPGIEFGDANDDGSVNAGDAVVVLRHSAGQNVTIDLAAGDANDDGKVNAGDAVVILRYSAGQINQLPPPS